MQSQVQSRLDALRKEWEAGQQRMQELERHVAQLRDTMLRISGAIQILEELQSAVAEEANGVLASADAGSGADLLGV